MTLSVAFLYICTIKNGRQMYKTINLQIRLLKCSGLAMRSNSKKEKYALRKRKIVVEVYPF